MKHISPLGLHGGLQLLLAVLALTGSGESQRRNLTDIAYKYRTCGMSGRLGPSFTTCQNYYREKQSLIHKHDVLFEFEDGDYLGAQGFRAPKRGIYNITATGASGGWGLCSLFEGGHGQNRTIQIHLPADYELLIMVGQEGIGPCSIIPVTDPLYTRFCINRPEFTEEIDNCTARWNSTFNTNPDFFAVFGGAGGGGASMVRGRNKTSGQFDQFPILIAAGGAGTPALVDYDIVDEIGADNPFLPSRLIYKSFINGQTREFDTQYGTPGTRGIRSGVIDTLTSAGSGGGYNTGILRSIEVDGQALVSPQNFAQGGVDCLQFLAPRIDQIPYKGAFGGFGGGGGACGGGGAGGGYTGGPILGQGLTVPAGGGYSYLGNTFSNFPVIDIFTVLATELGHGFVNIVPADCGCVHECVVYGVDSQFECLCPNDTFIAPDLSDCFEEKELLVDEGNLLPLRDDGLYVRQLSLNSTIRLLSLRANVQVSPVRVIRRATETRPQGETCLLALLGEGSKVILVSDVISGSGEVDSLSSLQTDSSGNVTSQSNYVTMLDNSVVVTGVMLFSDGDCRLVDNRLTVNTSIETSELAVANITITNSTINQFLSNLANQLFAVNATQNTIPVGNVGVVVGTVIGGFVAVILIIIFIVLVGVACYKCRTRRSNRLMLRKLSPTSEGNGITTFDSLKLNSAYIRYQPHPQKEPETTESGYTTITIEAGEDEYVKMHSSPTSHFEPRYGITVPDVDFFTYNRQRAHSVIKDWSYPRSNLIYMRELGEGQFGKALLMKATNIAGYKGKIPVAVKTLTSRDPEVIGKFMEEAELMKKFSHPNIVSLLGFIHQEKGEDSAPLMILEYMPYGDLHGFLQTHSPDADKSSLLKKLHFYTFAYDIAKGLEFLSTHSYVHRDLATRNCLVGTCLQIKIADFGLAKGVYDKDYYRLTGSAVLPVRWMAPECLMFGKFSSASDVWAYGVIIWEILTFGQLPLPDYEVQDIIDAAQCKSLEHSRPENSPDDLYQLMCRCHDNSLEDRPSFSDIVESELFNVVKKRPSVVSNNNSLETVSVENEELEESLQI